MSLVHKIEIWGDRHHPKFLDLVRIALGVFLVLKGIAFMETSAYLQDSIINQSAVNISPWLVIVLIYYMTFSLMVGGFFIVFGTLTRFSSLLQIPNVIIVLLVSGFFTTHLNTMEWPSVIALCLLILFAILGSGPLSLDHFVSEIDEE